MVLATSTSPARLLALALAGLAGCYTVTFEEDRPEIYYCVANSDCLASQACKQFRCVSDTGPKLWLTLPEPETLVANSELTVDFMLTDFVISDSNQKVEGQGKVHISIDSGVIEQTIVTKGALVDISSLEGGSHRVEIQAVYGDGTPYTNPSSYDHTAFFIAHENPDRPLVAILSPPPGYVHVAGEPLSVEVAVRNFALVDAGNDCKVPSDCDPFDAASPECVPSCDDPPSGHAHIYLIDDYPACLKTAPIGCNGDYLLSMRPSETNTSTNSLGAVAIGEVEGRFIEAPGRKQLTVSLQYNDHDPYPAKSFVIYDSIEIDVIE